MDTAESSAPHVHPPAEEHDDTVEAHYACLDRPHACIDGWVSMEVEVVDPETGEENVEEAHYLCRRCAEEAR